MRGVLLRWELQRSPGKLPFDLGLHNTS